MHILASSYGSHHGHPMELHWDSWMGGCHAYLGKLIWKSPWASHGIALGLLDGWVPCISWQAHMEVTMGIPWNCIGIPGWVGAMHIFHGKLIWRSPWASHGIALRLLDGWVPCISWQ